MEGGSRDEILRTVWASMPPATMVPLKEGTVPDVYTMPLEVHAPLAESEVSLCSCKEKKCDYIELALGCRYR